jgi:hypothetical protein
MSGHYHGAGERYPWGIDSRSHHHHMAAIGILLCLSLTVLAGCATDPSPRVRWVRPQGITMEHARQDFDACQRDAETLPRHPMPQPRSHDLREHLRWKADQARRDRVFIACMQLKGYTWAPASLKD